MARRHPSATRRLAFLGSGAVRRSSAAGLRPGGGGLPRGGALAGGQRAHRRGRGGVAGDAGGEAERGGRARHHGAPRQGVLQPEHGSVTTNCAGSLDSLIARNTRGQASTTSRPDGVTPAKLISGEHSASRSGDLGVVVHSAGSWPARFRPDGLNAGGSRRVRSGQKARASAGSGRSGCRTGQVVATEVEVPQRPPPAGPLRGRRSDHTAHAVEVFHKHRRVPAHLRIRGNGTIPPELGRLWNACSTWPPSIERRPDGVCRTGRELIQTQSVPIGSRTAGSRGGGRYDDFPRPAVTGTGG